jgi:3-deoxy-manno-octulosonate cytidylyltransferase (CMP-KDO synthetase)
MGRPMSVLIVIPARMKATRLPNKPMALIAGEPMIVQVWRRAVESGVGEVVVACDCAEIADAIRAVGGVAVLTNPDHPSGSDRIWEAVGKVERDREASASGKPSPLAGEGLDGGAANSAPSSPRPLTQPSPAGGEGFSASRARVTSNDSSRFDIVINLQGDVPTLEPLLLRDLLAPLENMKVDIATLAAPIMREEEHANPSVVKAVLALEKVGNTGRALYFTRASAPYGEGIRYHHIGVYAYRRAALEKFVSLPPSPLEQREKLEQLRALEAGLRIDVVVVDTVPLGVDTPEDLARAREILK